MFHVIHCSFHDPNLRAGHGENFTPPGTAGLAGHDGGADGGGPLQPPHHLAGCTGHVHRGRPGPVQRLLWLHGTRAAGVHRGYGAVFCHIAPLKRKKLFCLLSIDSFSTSGDWHGCGGGGL